MDIEDSIKTLKEFNKIKINSYAMQFVNISYPDLQEAIETLLTAYENLKSYNKGTKEALRVAEDLEHQANKEAGDWEARCFELEAELEKEKAKNKEYNMGIKNLISQIESAIDFMKTNKSKIKVDMYQQKEKDLKLEIVHLKKLLKEE